MNVFVPQSIQTMMELAEIADVKRQIISPRFSTPIIGIVQDGVLGSYNLTSPTMKIDWKDAMNIISYTSIDDFTSIKKNTDIKGSDLFSLIVPNKINVSTNDFEIENGKIIKGQISKAHIGAKKQNSLIHLIWDEYGINETKNFIDDVQKLVNNFNLLNGFSCGIGDLDIPKDVTTELTKFFETKKLEAKHMITEMENNPDLLDQDTFEETLYSNLNNIREEASKMVMKNLKLDNNFYIMIFSGAKGEPINMGQMLGCIGQQAVEGTRIKKNVNGRTLQYFHKDDDTALARGFVEQSFLKGMHPLSFIFHNMGSREGLIDTAIKTAESGYMQRKLIKSMEDAMIKYDLTVRNANNTVIQFIYGDGGIDTTKQYEYTSKILELGNTEITRRYKFTDEELKANSDFTKKQNEEYIANLILMRNQIRDISIRTGLNQILLNKKFMLPINYFRIMSNKTKTGNGKLTVEYILKRIDEILSSSNTFLMCMNKNELVNPKSIKNIDQNIAKTLFKFSLHEHLAPKICLYDRKLSKEQFDIICNDIINSYNNHVVSVGEMIGTIAAQSLGEPLTQMTLNSVDWEEEIIISDNGFFKVVKIGEFTDKLIEENLEKVEHVGDIKDKEMGDTYYLDIKDKGISAISVNEDGKVSWNLIEAVTKHLPMNTDGTSDLVKITTEMGRTATATKAKSFLTRIDNKIVPIRGDELKIGTYLPTITEIPDNDIYNLNKFDISPYFPKNDYTNDIIPGNNLKHHKGDVQRQVLKNITDESTDEQKIINDCMDSKIYYDKIKAIELISPTKKYVYDLTVANDKTFALGGGLVQNDTFHSAGIGGMGTTTLGVPRIKEIFSFSRNMKTPIMIIYMEDKLRKNKEIVEKIASSIEKTTIGDIRDRVDVYYDPTPFAKDGFMEKDSVTNVFHHVTQSKYSCQSDISGLPWLMRIVLNKEKMMEKDITLLDIKSKFCNYWEKRFNDIKGTKKEDKQLLEKINQCSLLSNNDNDTVPILHLRFDMKDFNYGTITSFLDNLIDGFQLKGIQNIEKINAVVDERLTTFDQDQAEKVDSQYVIYAAGINMTALRYINGIDLNKTKSNDIVDICEKYGIEAARMALLKECESVYGTSGNFVNYQHISVLADVMTNNGTLTTIDRHGLNKVETDPFARASFEKTVDQFIQAAVYSEVDHMKSVSSRIMAGLAIKGGTGFCDVVLDYELLEKSEYIEDVENKYVKTFHKLSANPVMNDILSKAPSEVFMPDV